MLRQVFGLWRHLSFFVPSEERWIRRLRERAGDWLSKCSRGKGKIEYGGEKEKKDAQVTFREVEELEGWSWQVSVQGTR